MNPNQARAIAKAVSFIRPDWQETSLYSLLSDLPAARRDRPARDVMLALVWLAYDPNTDKPGRLKLDGPWWHIADTAARTEAAPNPTAVAWCQTHGRPYLGQCRYCRDGQAVEPAGTGPTPEQRAAIRVGIEAGRQATHQLANPRPEEQP